MRCSDSTRAESFSGIGAGSMVPPRGLRRIQSEKAAQRAAGFQWSLTIDFYWSCSNLEPGCSVRPRDLTHFLSVPACAALTIGDAMSKVVSDGLQQRWCMRQRGSLSRPEHSNQLMVGRVSRERHWVTRHHIVDFLRRAPTTPSASQPPLLWQEGNYKLSPPFSRRGGAKRRGGYALQVCALDIPPLARRAARSGKGKSARTVRVPWQGTLCVPCQVEFRSRLAGTSSAAPQRGACESASLPSE